MHLQAKGRSGSDTSKPSCCTRRSYIFRIYFRYNGLLHISINYTENVTDLYAHAQTVDTRRSSPIFQAPGYEAIAYEARGDTLHYLMKPGGYFALAYKAGEGGTLH